MTNNQVNQTAMMSTVGNIFVKYSEPISSIKAMSDSVTEFKITLSEIKKTVMIQEGKITGTTEQKQKEELEMINAVVRVAAALYVYGIDNSNFELTAKADINPSALKNMNQASLQAACTMALALAKEHINNLSDYGVSGADVSDLEKEINDYITLVAAPRSEIVTRSQATSLLKELIKKQMGLLNMKIDKIMVMFKDTQPVFYNEYKSARIIVNMGVRHNEPEEAEAA